MLGLAARYSDRSASVSQTVIGLDGEALPPRYHGLNPSTGFIINNACVMSTSNCNPAMLDRTTGAKETERLD
jgi:hypothetical protein